LMQELKNKQQKKVEREKYVNDVNEESEDSDDSAAKSTTREATQTRLQNDVEPDPETQKDKKDQLKKSLEQLFARSGNKPVEHRPKDDDQQRTTDDQIPTNTNSSTSVFPESLTNRIQLAPNLHMVRDRPNPPKNHVIRTYAGALARNSESLDINDADN